MKKVETYTIKYIRFLLQNLIGFRGTLQEITKELQEISLRDNICLEPFEESYPELDYGYNVNLGEIGDKYLDYEIFMLKTNHEDIYIITEINEF